MANSAAGGASDYNTQIIKEFRANEGHVGGPWTDTPLILIHHIGARSGIERVTPVACSPQGDGRFAIWPPTADRPPTRTGTTTSRPTPGSPSGGPQTFTVLAEELDGTARAELWPKLVAEWPKPVAGSPDLGVARQAGTTRQFPVFLLTRQELTLVRRDPA